MSKFLQISGYESRYSISEIGEVLSIKKNKLLKKQIDKYGYEYIIIRDKNQIKKKHMIHILVYESFIGQRKKGLVIDHIDNNRVNNSIENLRQITIRQNSRRGHKKYRNVVSAGNRFAVKFHIEGKKRHFGYFKTEKEAMIKADQVRNMFGFKPVLL